MATPIVTARPKTLSDVYAERDLTDAQVRRIVALLGLAQPRRHAPTADDPQPDCARLGA